MIENTEFEVKEFNKDLTVSKRSNELIFAAYDLGIIAQDILQVVISQIRNEDINLNAYEIKISELEKKIGKRLKDPILTKARQELLTTTIFLDFNEDIVDGFTWCSKFRWNKKERTITIQIHEDLNDYLIDLVNKGRFTIIRDKYFFPLKSSYSKRIYMILVNIMDNALNRKAKIGKYITSPENLATIVSVPDSLKNSFSDLNKRVIKSSVKEINEKTDLNVEVIYNKEGRKVKTIEFKITEKAQRLEERNERSISAKKVAAAKSVKSSNSGNQNMYANSGVSALDQWLKEQEETDSSLTIDTQAV